MNLRDGYAAVVEAAAAAWRVPPQLTVSAWADAKRQLSAKASPEPGQWRTARTPFWREPMDVLSDHHMAGKVSVMAASQMGKSEVMNNWVGYTIDHAPCPMLLVEPTVDLCEKYSKQRIEPMIEACPDLRDKVPSARKRDSGNTTLVKEYPNGVLIMVGANSPSGLASMPIKHAAFDETDRYPDDIGDQGSPIKQAEQRTIAFPRGKIGHFSTPVRVPVEDDDGNESGGSHIWRSYQAGSRARYHVACPHCGHLQHLEFKNLAWEKETTPEGRSLHKTETALYMCQGCGVGIEERHKPQMLADQAMGGQARWVHERPNDDHLSYHINALYTPIGLGRSWAKIAKEWIEACRDRSKLVTFWNLILGLPFDDHADRLRDADLFGQAEDLPLQTVPAGYYKLTMAVDTQGDWLDVQVQAWSRNERTVVVDRFQLAGDPEKEAVWLDLTERRRKRYPNAHGRLIGISMCAIDSGGSHTQRVYAYARAWRNDNVIAVKGAGDPYKPVLSRPTKQDVKNARGDVTRNGVRLWMVGTHAAKHALFNRLSDWADEQIPPPQRMVRMSKLLGHEHFRQLTAEVYDEQAKKWVQLRKRNETIDLCVYNHAAACHPHVRADRMSDAEWDQLEALFEPRTTDLFDPSAAVQASALPAGASVASPAGPSEPPEPRPATARTGRLVLPRRAAQSADDPHLN